MPLGCTPIESPEPSTWADALRAPREFIRDRSTQTQEVAPIELQQSDLISSLSIHSLARRVLQARGLSGDEIDRFLDPPDPHRRSATISGIERLRDLIQECRGSGEKIAVQVDYDVDGLSTGAVLETVLSTFGIPHKVYISNRHQQGYDVQREILKQASAEGCSRLVIGDLGSHRGDLLSAAVKEGLFRSYLVLDHHPSDERDLKAHAFPIVNPNQPSDSSGLTQLCASGLACVAGMRALEEIPGLSVLQREEALSRITALASLGSIADIVPLAEENRWIVRVGLGMIKLGTLPGIQALAAAFNQKLDLINEESVAFFIGPAINSASRVSWKNAKMLLDGALHGRAPGSEVDAQRYARVMSYARSGKADRLTPGLEALEREMREIESTTPIGVPLNLTRIAQNLLRAQSVEAAESSAKALHALNILRQGIEFHGYEVAKEVLSKNPPLSSSPVVAAFSPLFDIGTAGLVASRLAREFGRPVAIVTVLDSAGIVDSGGREIYAASVRSGPTTMHVGRTLAECSEFFSRGGHQAAGGFKCYAENYPGGIAQWEAAILREGYERNPPERVDLTTPFRGVSKRLLELRESLAPAGQAAAPLRIEARGAWVRDITMWKREHTRVELSSEAKSITAYVYRNRLPSAIKKGECVNVVLSIHRQGTGLLYIIEDAAPAPIHERHIGAAPLYAQPQFESFPFDPFVRRRVPRSTKTEPAHAVPGETLEQSMFELDLRQARPVAKNSFGEVLKVPESVPKMVAEMGINCLRVEHLDYVLQHRDAQVKAALAFTETNGNVLWPDPTGAGKTVKAIIVMATELSRLSHQRILVTAPTNPILDQWRKEIAKYLDLPDGAVWSLTPSVPKGDRARMLEDVRHRIVISSPELINQIADRREYDLGALFQLAILDERHVAQGNHALARLERTLKRNGVRTLDLTATPGRSPARLAEQLFVAGAEIRPSEAKRKQIKEELHTVQLTGKHLEAVEMIRGSGERLAMDVLYHAREFPRLYHRVHSAAFVQGETNQFVFPGITERNAMAELVRPLSGSSAKLKEAFYTFYRAAHMFETLAWSGALPYLDYAGRLIVSGKFPKDLALRNAFLHLSKGTAFEDLSRCWSKDYDPKALEEREKLKTVREAVQRTSDDPHFRNHPKDDRVIDLISKHREFDPGIQLIVPVREVVVAKHLTQRIGMQNGLSADFVIGKRGQNHKKQISAVQRFKNGEYSTMLGTSAVELGLDVANAQIVIHHSVALTPEADEQRNGRAGRREKSGVAYRIVTEGTGEETVLLRLLHRRKLMRSATKQPAFRDDRLQPAAR